ncbi:hypothetical protein RyT2_07690 [Pseudolactococcus yaeyamensis]
MRCIYKGYELSTRPVLPLEDLEEHGTCNGYIKIPEFQDISYWDIPQGNIHGGWTYRNDDVFGFDTLHFNSKKYMDEEWVINHLKEYVDEVLSLYAK